MGQNNIIFLDQDTMSVNSRIVYEIDSDTENVHPLCTGFNTDHNMLNSSVISCSKFYFIFHIYNFHNLSYIFSQK